MTEAPGIFESIPAFADRPVDTDKKAVFARILNVEKVEEFLTMHRYAVTFLSSDFVDVAEIAQAVAEGLENVGPVSLSEQLEGTFREDKKCCE